MQHAFISKTLIDKGWSHDKKYRVTAKDGTSCLLRVAADKKITDYAELFRMQKEAAARGVPMPKPVEFGSCGEGVYILETWIDGGDANEIIPQLADARQYALGLDAGRILKKIHSIPAPNDQPDWERKYHAKIDRNIKKYQDCPIKFDGADLVLDYINANF